MLRRLLWALPALIGVSIVSFLFLSYVPDPTADPAFAASLTTSELARLRRERFLDLPRFLNPEPHDVHERADDVVDMIVAEGPRAAEAREELTRLGGAALPFVLPRFDALPPDRRVRLALALAPIAQRMGIDRGGEAEDPNRAVGFWTRFWDDRSIEFRRAAVRSSVNRLVRYGSVSRANDLIELDTFVLDDVITALEMPVDDAGVARARVLLDVASHVTNREDRIEPGDDLMSARACVDRWQAYWSVYRGDFVAQAGLSRVSAMVLETRYGKWALGAVTHRFGRSAVGVPVLDELTARGKITLTIVFGAIALAYLLGVPLGIIRAASRGRQLDAALTALALALYAIPTATLAVLARRAGGPEGSRMLLAIAVLGAGLLAAPTAQQSAALEGALAHDYVRAATARGASRARAVLVHGLRNALLPAATLAAVEGPMALSGAFVVERVFGLHGLGEATLVAVQMRDISWLMAIAISASMIAAAFVLATDLVYVAIDPRLSPTILARKGQA